MITPNMIEAGAAALRECKEGLDEGEKALIVFEAMTAAAPVEEPIPDPVPAYPAEKIPDALHILKTPDKFTAEQIAWARAVLAAHGVAEPVPPVVTPPVVTPPAPTGTPIADQAALIAALSSAKGGETFLLAPGGYSLTLSSKTFSPPITITSAGSRAKFGFVKLTDVTGLTMKNLEIGHSSTVAKRESDFMMNLTVRDFVLEGSYVHGSLDSNPLNDGVGIKLWSYGGVKIINNEFAELGRCGTLSGDGITVTGNHIHDIRSEGFQFSNVRNVTIESNVLEKWNRDTGDHPDAIQFFTAGSNKASSDIRIRGNIILCNREGAQGIFLRDEVGGLPFQRVLIENNFVFGRNMANGIYVDGGKDVAVLGNTVVSPTDDGNPVWISLSNITGLDQARNIADSGGQKTPAQVFTGVQMKLLTTAGLDAATPDVVKNLFVTGMGSQLGG